MLTNPPLIGSPHTVTLVQDVFLESFLHVGWRVILQLLPLDTPHARNLWEWFSPRKVQAKDPLKSKLLRKTITGFVESSEEKENFAPWPLNVSDRLFDGSQQLKDHWLHMVGWLYREHNLAIRLQARLFFECTLRLWTSGNHSSSSKAKISSKIPSRNTKNLEFVCKTYICAIPSALFCKQFPLLVERGKNYLKNCNEIYPHCPPAVLIT